MLHVSARRCNSDSCVYIYIYTYMYVCVYIYIYIYAYLLTPWCRALLEKLTGLQLVKKFPAFYGTRRVITALTSVRHLSLSCASPIQSTYPHPTSWRSILILSTHLRVGLPNGLFPSGFPTKTLYAPTPHPYTPHAQPISYILPTLYLIVLCPIQNKLIGFYNRDEKCLLCCMNWVFCASSLKG